MLPDRITELLSAYVDGELSARERKTVLRLLQRSPEARRFFKKLKSDSMILRTLPRRKLKEDLSGSVMLSIQSQNLHMPQIPIKPFPVQKVKRRLPRWAVLAIAGAILLVVGAGSYFLFTRLGGSGGVVQKPEPTQPDERPPIPKHDDPEPEPEPVAVVHDPDLPVKGARPPLKDLYSKMTPRPQPFQTAQPRLALILPVRDLDAIPGQQLQKELEKDTAIRIDLFSSDTPRAVERLQVALKAQNINLRVDSAAQTSLGRKVKVVYALYTEDLNPEELVKVLGQVGADERKSGPIFDRVVVNALTPLEVARVLGGDPTSYPPPARGPLGVDITKPLADQTSNQILKSLQTNTRPDPSRGLERLAMVVAHNPPQTLPSKDVQSYLAGRKPFWRDGAVQVFIVVWNN